MRHNIATWFKEFKASNNLMIFFPPQIAVFADPWASMLELQWVHGINTMVCHPVRM